MPPELQHSLPILLAIFFTASVVQGATGFGFGLFSVAALSLFVQLTTSTPLLAILNTPVIFYVLWRLVKHVVWKDFAYVAAGLLVGIPIGTFVLVNWPQQILLRVLAVVLIAAAVHSLRARNSDTAAEREAPRTIWNAVVAFGVGIGTGALAGAFNTGGPPVIAYVYCKPWSKQQRTGTLQAVFGLSVIARIITYSAAGLYNTGLLLTAAACLPAAGAGMLAGYAVFRRFPPRALEIFVSIFLMFVGVKLMIWPGG